MPESTTSCAAGETTAAPTEATTKELPFMVGADPEISAYFGDMAIDAQPVMDTFLPKLLERNDNTAEYIVPGKGMIGKEGSRLFELRPEPSRNPDTFVENFRAMFEKMNEGMPNIGLSTLSITAAAGGHIHLDIGEMSQASTIVKTRIQRLMSSFLIPILASEHRVCSGRRNRESNYGKISDIRWGECGGKTMEVRGLTTEWLTTPRIAKATVAYMAVVWHEIKKNHAKLNKEEFCFKSMQQNEAIQKMILSDIRLVEKSIIDKMRIGIRKFELYPQWQEEIEFIMNPEAVFKEKEKVGWNIYEGWNIRPTESITTKKELLNHKKAAENLKSLDIEGLEKYMGVSYNEDYNMNLVAQGIMEHCIAFGLKFQKEYYLFGLKKNVRGYLAAERLGEDSLMYYTFPENVDQSYDAIANNMINRFVEKRNYDHGTRINPRTGKIFNMHEHRVVIGIPYDDRASRDLKKVLGLIWDIEKNNLKAHTSEYFINKRPEVQNKEDLLTRHSEDESSSSMRYLLDRTILPAISRENLINAAS